MREFQRKLDNRGQGRVPDVWTHRVPARTRKDAAVIAERDLRAEGTELVRSGAGTYVAVDRLANCKH